MYRDSYIGAVMDGCPYRCQQWLGNLSNGPKTSRKESAPLSVPYGCSVIQKKNVYH